MTWNSW